MNKDHSNRYLPNVFPPFLSEIEEITPTKYSIPITILLKNNQNSNLGLKKNRLMVALLKAFQMAHHNSYFTTLHHSSKLPDYPHYQQTPIDSKTINEYMMDTLLKTKRNFFAKLY
jgi:hypothetical protein